MSVPLNELELIANVSHTLSDFHLSIGVWFIVFRVLSVILIFIFYFAIKHYICNSYR